MTHNYFRDPTHAAPLHPDTLCYVLELAGIKVLEVMKLSEYPKGALLENLITDNSMSPNFRGAVEAINRNFSQLNNLLYGAQDYCVVAEVD